MKRILSISIKIIGLAAVVFVVVFAFNKSKEQKCTDVRFDIVSEDKSFIGVINEVKSDLKVAGYDALEGILLSAIDLKAIEIVVEKSPYVANAEVYSTIRGIVYVKIEQRVPLVRIYNHDGNSFFVDKDGFKMPILKNSNQHILVANGFIVEKLDSQKNVLSPMAKKIVFTANVIAADSLMNALCEQLYVNSQFEIEMITRVGDHKVIIGDTTDLSEKLNKLAVFYREGYKNEDLDKYQSINLKFKGQVVCKKRVTNG